jgi:4-carboxymuconolactone decarboxylase
MSRIPEITKRDQLPEDQRPHYDSIMASRNQIVGPYAYLLHCPDLAARTAHLAGYSLFTSDFPKEQKELVICTVAREFDCVFEWAAHEGHARDAGVREETIAAIRDGKAPEGLSDEEADFVKYVQELLRPPHRITEPTFQALRNRLGDARLAELTGIIGGYVALACSLNAFDVQAPEGRPVLPT